MIVCRNCGTIFCMYIFNHQQLLYKIQKRSTNQFHDIAVPAILHAITKMKQCKYFVVYSPSSISFHCFFVRFEIASCRFHCIVVQRYNYWSSCCVEIWPCSDELGRRLQADNGDIYCSFRWIIQHLLYLVELPKQLCPSWNSQKRTKNIHGVLWS